MSLQNVKTLLEIDSNDRDDLLGLIMDLVRQQLQMRLGEPVPEELEHIVTEVTVRRFNRLGSEGMKSESVEGHSVTYIQEDLAPYESDIQAYLNKDSDTRQGVVRFL